MKKTKKPKVQECVYVVGDEMLGTYDPGDMIPCVPILEFDEPDDHWLVLHPAAVGSSDCASISIAERDDEGQFHKSNALDALETEIYANIESATMLDSFIKTVSNLSYRTKIDHALNKLRLEATKLGYSLVKNK